MVQPTNTWRTAISNAADNLSFIDGNPLHPRFDSNRFGGTLGGPIKEKEQILLFLQL